MQFKLTMAAILVLTACTPRVPDDAVEGVGFKDYNQYLDEKRARDEALAQGRPVSVPPASAAQVGPQEGAQASAQTEEQQTANAALEAIGARPANDASAVLVNPTGAPASPQASGPVLENASISDEQDFDAVANRQTIQSDAQRRAQQSAQYQVIAPEAVPRRPSGTTPTPIEFAVQTSHPVGQKLYRRTGGSRNIEANCAKYSSNELAQDAFLQAGGPERDKLRIDPDGDGYACGWSPTPYRNLAHN